MGKDHQRGDHPQSESEGGGGKKEDGSGQLHEELEINCGSFNEEEKIVLCVFSSFFLSIIDRIVC